MSREKPTLAITNDVAWTLQQLNDLYEQGRLKGFTAQVLLTEGEHGSMQCGDISYIEKLGLIESAKQDLLISVVSDE